MLWDVTAIESFVRAFEDGSLARSEWTHSGHLVMALWYLRRYDREKAIALIRIRSAEPSLPGVVAWPPDRA